MASKVGELIKEARTAAGLTQEKLARKVGGITAAEVSKAERGELELPQATLKKIATATGVTQASLINAAKGTSKSTKTSTAKASAKTTAKTPDSAGITMRVTATEKRLVQLYREADGDTKKAAMNVLKGESSNLIGQLIGGVTGGKTADSVADMLGDALGSLLGGK